jgi:hypothetical protein
MAPKPKSPSKAESEAAAPLPDVAGATLELHWTDFKKLLERHAAQAPRPEEAGPPVPFIVGPVALEGEVVAQKPGFAALTAQFDVKVVATGWTPVPLIEGTLALREATADGKSLVLDPEEQSPYTALLEGPCDVHVTLAFDVPLQADSEQSGFGVTFPAAPVVNVTLVVPRTGLEVEVSSGVGTSQAEKAGATTVRSSVPSGEEVQVSWTRAREVVREKPLEPPQIFVRTESFIAVGDGVAKANHTLVLNVVRSPIRALTVEVPADATVADVRGQQVAGWEARLGKPGEPQVVHVELRGEVKGPATLVLLLDRPWDEAPPIRLPLVKVRGAERESGFVAVAAMTSVEITPAEAKGLQRIDLKELPPGLVGRMPHPVVLAYKFREAGGELPVMVQRHADLPVVTAMADTAEHTLLQTADGKRVARSIYRIRNAQRQFVRLALPKGATVWSTLLDGQAVKPAQGNEGEILVPLKKAATFADTETPFTVEVVTMTEGPALAEKGTLQVTLPRCDLPVGALRFSLWLPEGFLYDDFTGTLEEVRGFRDPWSPEGTVSQAMQHVTPTGNAGLAPPKPPEVRLPPPPAPPPPPPSMGQGMPQAIGYGGPAGGAVANRAVAAPAKVSLGESIRSKKMSKESRRERSDRDEAEEEKSAEMDYMAADDEASMDMALPSGIDYTGNEIAGFEAPKDIGVLPVKITVPEKGLCFAFEKLLVLDEPLNVQTEYSREKISRAT